MVLRRLKPWKMIVGGMAILAVGVACCGRGKPDSVEVITTKDEDTTNWNLNALLKAKSYSSDMHMSKAAIYEQLTVNDRFTEEEGKYAIDHLDADYKENALAKAEIYAKDMHMSKAAIFWQLSSEAGEQFTEKEAQYAIDTLEVDYKLNALEKAKELSTTMHMSKAEVYEQLASDTGERFTEFEAQYAVDNLR